MLLGIGSAFSYNFAIDGIYYSIISDSTVSVSSNNNAYSGHVEIPNNIQYEDKFYDVIKIGYAAFKDCNKLSSIKIGNNVKEIEQNAFENCVSLNTLNIPDEIKIIRKSAFKGCSTLSNVTIGKSVEKIEADAFTDCICLHKIHINDGNTTLEFLGNQFIEAQIDSIYMGRNLYASQIFKGQNLNYLGIGDSVTRINNYVFDRCAVDSLYIPKNVTYIGQNAFANASHKYIKFEDTTTPIKIMYRDHENYYTSSRRERSMFYKCDVESVYIGRPLEYETAKDSGYSPFYDQSSIKNVVLGDSVSHYPTYLLLGCPALESLVISKNVKTFGIYNLFSSNYLEHVFNYSESPQKIADDCFSYYGTLHVPNGCEDSYKDATGWKNFKIIGDLPGINTVVTSIKLDKTEITCKKSDVGKLNIIETLPDNATKLVTWTSSAPDIVLITSDGTYVAIATGVATITATAQDEGKASASCIINVISDKAESISLDKTELSLAIGETFSLTATVLPENCLDKSVSWSSSDNKVATVEGGKVLGVGIGTATITATSGPVSATCVVEVKPILIEAIVLDKTQISLNEGETVQMSATTYPTNATIKQLEWSSSNTEIATVDANGLVTCIKEGMAIITATATDGSGKSAICIISVTSGIEGVNEDSITEVARYDVYGKLLNEKTQGVNIVVYSDGSVKKEIVK